MLVQLLAMYTYIESHSAERYRQRQTDRWTDDRMHANSRFYCVAVYDRLKTYAVSLLCSGDIGQRAAGGRCCICRNKWRADIMAAILKAWRHLKNLDSVNNRCVFPRTQSCRISFRSDLKRRRLGLFWRASPFWRLHKLVKKGKGKGRYSSSWEPHLRATGRHLPYGITQCYLPPDTSERAPPNHHHHHHHHHQNF